MNSAQPATSARNTKRLAHSKFLLSALALAAAAITPAALPKLLHAQTAGGETGVSVESSQQLFATMCALDAAGYDADESTLAEMPYRLKLREDLLNMQGPSVDAVRAYYKDHRSADPGETLSKFITFAVVVGPPPRFTFTVDRDVLPPDALAIEGFQEVLANFYRDAHLERRWTEVQPEYDRAIQRDESPVRHIVLATNGYLREIYKPKFGHSFTVYVEPLVGKRTNFRNTGDHYSIVIGAGSEFPYDDGATRVSALHAGSSAAEIPQGSGGEIAAAEYRREVAAAAGGISLGLSGVRGRVFHQGRRDAAATFEGRQAGSGRWPKTIRTDSPWCVRWWRASRNLKRPSLR